MGFARGFPAKAALSSAAFSFLFCACAGPESFGGSLARVEAWAGPRGFSASARAPDVLAPLALLRHRAPASRLTVYIEGDGAAWATPYHPPADPTPVRPIPLVLADQDPAAAVAYLGRSCQYLDPERLSACSGEYWTRRRFSPEVLLAAEVALDVLKARSGASRLTLVGYSGGGVVAALLAARRNDVSGLVTIAAPLALEAWAGSLELSPLTGSLDPLRHGGGVAAERAWHFVGSADAVVPASIVARYVAARGGTLEVVPGFDHDCCWTRDWLSLLGRVHVEESTR